jgi:hypothetical protein
MTSVMFGCSCSHWYDNLSKRDNHFNEHRNEMDAEGRSIHFASEYAAARQRRQLQRSASASEYRKLNGELRVQYSLSSLWFSVRACVTERSRVVHISLLTTADDDDDADDKAPVTKTTSKKTPVPAAKRARAGK